MSAVDSHDLFLRVNKSGLLLNLTQSETTLQSQDSQLILNMKENLKRWAVTAQMALYTGDRDALTCWTHRIRHR